MTEAQEIVDEVIKEFKRRQGFDHIFEQLTDDTRKDLEIALEQRIQQKLDDQQ